ncbi:S8 family serine peptidase [Natronosalvus caseinilyticus]|uniref:S8 family serine peptidase n=1 Tax=Natronosalvus caseinilyticus TaxID=2953747 RepID=UPI0028A7F58C|nr:S8 family serine peptidase [Natronosalvus caseinilyticus]
MTERPPKGVDESPSVVSRRQVLQGTAGAGLLALFPTASGSADETTEVVVRAEDVDVPLVASDSVVDELEATAEQSQAPIVEYVEETDGLAVKNRFWLANALLLEVDTGVVDLEQVTAQEGVSEVHPNFRYEIPEPDVGTASEETGDVTYGLEQIDAPAAWDAYDSRGEGARIAVLDTGVDPTHPDIDLEPEHFAEFDGDGEQVGSEPHDSHYHGTHVSGTVAGGDASGTAIGVAPDATLLGGLVLPDGGGSFAQIIGGMQWAVEEDADAINMSLGITGYVGEMIEPVRNADRAGTVVVSSSGNSRVGTSGSPANVYDAFAIGASNEDEAIAEFSSGETISTADDWGHLAPDDWPESYVVPDVSAPGVDVTSAFPVDHANGPYHAISGTSMASPHVAGVVGLIRSATLEEATPERVKRALAATAWKPEGESDDPDIRYGRGIVDAFAAVGRVAADSGVTGTVTDSDGAPIDDATVTLDRFPVETNADGEFQVRAIPGTYELTADAFGYAADTVTVEVDDGFQSVDFTLGDSLAIAVVDGQPEGLEAGESFDVTANVAHVESVTVEQVGDYVGEAWLEIDGEQAAFGDRVDFESARSDEITFTIGTESDGVGNLELEHTFAGLGDSVTVSTGPTFVYDEPVPIGIVDAGSGYAADLEAILAEAMHPRYRFDRLEPAEALDAAESHEHEGYVVQNLGGDPDLVADFVDMASAPEIGAVYLDQFGEASDAVSQVSDATGDPRETSEVAAQVPYPIAYPIEYDVSVAHPVFEGIAADGERVTITEPDPVSVGIGVYYSGFHSYFEGYSGGVAGSTVASTAVASTETGDGLAIDDLSRVAHASSLGLGTFVDRDAVTDAGRSLLGNLVAHAAATPPIDVVTPPAERVAPGESVTLEVAVENLEEMEVGVTGLQFLDEGDLSLSIDGERVAFDDPLEFDAYDGTVEITVDTSQRIGEFAISTRFVTLGDRDQEIETAATFRPTTVYESPLRVPEQVDDLQAAVDFVREGDTVELADGVYEVDTPDRGFQTGLYVGTPGITIRGVDGATPSIVHERDLPGPRIIHLGADDVTLENVEANVIDGEVDSKNAIGTGVLAGDGTSNVTIRNVTAAGTFGVQLHETTDALVEDVTAFGTVVGVGTDSGFFGTVDGATIRNVTVTDSPDYSFQGGVIVNGATRVTVIDCHLEHEDGDQASVALFGPFDGGEDCRITNNTIVGPDEEPYSDDRNNGIYVDGVDVVVEDNHIVDSYTGIRVAEYGFGIDPPAVSIERNTIENAGIGFRQFGDTALFAFNDVGAATGLDLGPGYFGLDADAVLARYNDLSATDLPFRGEPSDGWNAPEGPFDCRENYLGDRSYGDTIVDGDVVYDPYLTVPPADLESADVDADAGALAVDAIEPTEIATDLSLDPGGSYAIGFPGPTDQTIYDVLGVDGYGEFAGEIEMWNHDAGKWKSVTGDGNLQYADTLYAFRVTPAEGVRAEVHFQRADDPPVGPDGTPPGHRDSDLEKTHLQDGWNFVAAPAYGDEEDVFEMDVVDSIDDSLHAPGGQIGDGQKTAFTGYLVEATDDHWLDAGITAYDPTMTELYEGLGLDPQIHANPGPSADAGGMDRTLESVLEAPGDEEIAVKRVAAFVTERLATVDLDADLDDVLEEFSTTAETTAAETPSAHADLVAEATDLAAEEAVETLIQAEFLDEEGDETDPDRTVESHAEKRGGSTLSRMRRSVATDD